MARRRGRRPPNPGGNPDGLGVGALADGDLQHGERPIVESLATGAQGPAGPPAPQPQGGGGGGEIDLFAPSQRPQEPIQDGMPGGPGASGGVLDDDPDMFLRAAMDRMPHPDIARMLEAREF